jgi:hypothetical protein
VGRPPALRVLYGTLGLAGIVAAGLLGGSLAHHAARRVHDSARSSTTRTACRSERSVLRVAEDAYFARHPAFGGTYTDEAGLIADGLLARGSSRFDIVLGTPPTTYTIRAVPGRGCD